MNKKGEAYSALAGCYEYLMNSCDYEQWSQEVCKEVSARAPSRKGADVACGSGHFTRALKRAGFDVFGTDISVGMLNEAERITVKEGLSVPYFRGDMRKFRTNGKLGFITVVNDGVNYLAPGEVCKAFSSFARALQKGGLLLFDVSSEHKLKNVLGNNMFGEVDDDVSYLWFNRFDGEKVTMDLTFFYRKGDLYERKEETHVQYVHTEKFLLEKLEEAGFGEIRTTVTEQGNRLRFSALKR
ncbi:MAG: class I SAM-dependent methyltransferase [Candidatus Borkfalkiaceae bacterium]|nr:class I SAM-dependent methyltransferase [Christensenellaceae bacterium]